MDVTSWATGLLVDDPSLAEFLAAPSSSDNGRDRQQLVRGKSSGTTSVKLHDQPGAGTAALRADGWSVAKGTEVIAHVITGATFKSAAPGTIQHPATTTTEVTVQQVFSSKPAGTTRGHYGYVFTRAFFDDGTSEEVHAADIVPIVNCLLYTSPSPRDS